MAAGEPCGARQAHRGACAEGWGGARRGTVRHRDFLCVALCVGLYTAPYALAQQKSSELLHEQQKQRGSKHYHTLLAGGLWPVLTRSGTS